MGKKTSAKKKFASIKSVDDYLYLLENSHDALYKYDSQTREFDYVSPAITAITGFTMEEVMTKLGPRGLNKRVSPETQKKLEKVADELIRKKTARSRSVYIETLFQHKRGHHIWLGINMNFIVDKKGKSKSVIGNIRDITETKQLQQQLENSLENYKTLYNNAQAALYRTRISDGKMLECNESMARLLGYENREQCLAEHYSAKCYANPRHRSELMKLLEERKQVEGFEVETWRADGSALWIKVSVCAYPERGYLEGTIQDITASKILTPAENQILEQLMRGKCSKEIAFQLKRSIRTVEDHRSHIMQKLGAHNLVELTKKTMSSGVEPQ